MPKISNENRCFLTYNDLVENSETSLKKLTNFLDLIEPLSQLYKTQKYSQVWGDPSDNIKKGKIFNTKSTQLKIDKEILFKANVEYQKVIKLYKDLQT